MYEPPNDGGVVVLQYTLDSCLQPENAEESIELTLSGMVTLAI
jgi:hypothetical protein